MKCNWKVGALLIGGFVFGATPAMALTVPPPTGQWRVTYYNNDYRTTGPNYCVNYTTAGTPAPNTDASGTWSVPSGLPSGATWQGSWVQYGDHIKWWGSYNQQGGLSNYSTSHEGKYTYYNPGGGGGAGAGLITGHYQHYEQPGGGGTNGNGTWSAQRGC
jgi:hypothetical protein